MDEITNRELVERHWEHTHVCDGSYRSLPSGTVLIMCGTSHHGFDDWSAAAAFTRERLEEIRQLEREIEVVEGARDVCGMWKGTTAYVRQHCTWSRILSRLQSALAELKKGMRP